MSVTLIFAAIFFFKGSQISTNNTILFLLGTQLCLEAGSLVFQNCRNCLIPILYPNPNDIPRAHLWANVSSLTAAGIVPLFFLYILPHQEKIQTSWLVWVAAIDAVSFALSAYALFAVRHSPQLAEIENTNKITQTNKFVNQFKSGIRIIRKYPGVLRLLAFSFFYNLFLMGPFEIGHVTLLRKDLSLPPIALAVNLLLFLVGILVGSLIANTIWKHEHANHFRRFSKSILWDGLTFFPICIFAYFKNSIATEIFLPGLAALFVFHYALVPFVRVSRLAGIQTLANKSDWSSILGFHTIAVEGASALSVVTVALFFPDVSGKNLLALGGLGATLCGSLGLILPKR